MVDQQPHTADLTEPERRLFELARQEMPVAELAVRLGVPVGDAAARIEALCAHLGVADRAELQRLPGAGEPKRQRRYSRRALLSAGLAGGLTVAAASAGAVYWATRGGGSEPPVAPASPTRAGSPTKTPTAGLGVIQSAPTDMWESRNFAPGEEIDWPAGVFFLDAYSGAVEGWRTSDSGAANPALGSAAMPYPMPGGDILLLTAGQPADVFAYSRARKRAWRWPSTRLSLTDHLGDYYLFTDNTNDPATTSATAYVADDDFEPVSTFTVNTHPQISSPVLAPDRHHAAFRDGTDSGASRLRLIDLRTGKTVSTHVFDPALGELGGVEFFPLENDLLVGILRQATDVKGNPAAQRTSRLRLPWGADWSEAKEYDGPRIESVSPDGKYELRTVTMEGANGLGALYWTAVALHLLDGAQQFALLSASPPLWLGMGSQWLSDSSNFVVMNGAGRVDGPAWLNYAYSLVEPAGVQRQIPVPPLPAPDAPSFSPWMDSPTPSPAVPSLLALGTTGALDLKTGKSVKANLGKTFPPPIGAPWSGGRDEVVFMLPVGGKDGPGVPFFIQMRLIYGEIPSPPFQFTVARTGDCLNMRDAASLTANVVACVPDGTALTMADAPPTPAVPFGSWAAGDDGAWVYVVTSGGLKGWVAAPYLDWAV